MRKNMLMLLAAALLVVTGCKKDNKTENNGEKMIFTATIDNGGSKTQINGYDQVWTAGDKVSINGGEFTVTPKAGDPSWATFEGQTVNPDGEGKYKAIFPRSLCNGYVYELPATQTYDGNNLSGVNPLYAESTTQELVFHNICALMKLTLNGTTGSEKVTEIEVTANEPLSGVFYIDDYKAVLGRNQNSAGLTLDCGEGATLSTDGTTFYIAIPEGAYTDLTFTVTSDGGTWTYKAGEDGKIKVEANKLYESTQTPEFVSPAPPVPEGALSGKFSVGPNTNDQVYFAKGNMYWNGSSFNLENTQYALAEDANHKAQFYWSKTASVACASEYSDSYAATSDVFFTNAADGDTKPNSNFTANGETGVWRTLSNSELNYLMNSREGNRFASCYYNFDSFVVTQEFINEFYQHHQGLSEPMIEMMLQEEIRSHYKYGILLFPDNWNEWPSGAGEEPTNYNELNFDNAKVYTAEQLDVLGSKGCVFLVGNAEGMSYWTSTSYEYLSSGNYCAYQLFINYLNFPIPVPGAVRYSNGSVRLVRAAN